MHVHELLRHRPTECFFEDAHLGANTLVQAFDDLDGGVLDDGSFVQLRTAQARRVRFGNAVGH